MGYKAYQECSKCHRTYTWYSSSPSIYCDVCKRKVEIPKRFKDMDRRDLQITMQGAARVASEKLPPKGLFVLVAFDDDAGMAQYISNCERGDIIKAMRETADRLEKREDVPPTGVR